MANDLKQAMINALAANARKKDDDEERRRQQAQTTNAYSNALYRTLTGGSVPSSSAPSAGMVNATGTEAQTIQTPVLNAARGNDTKPVLPTTTAGMVNATGVDTERTGPSRKSGTQRSDIEERFKAAQSAYQTANAALQAEAMSGMASAETAAAAEKARQEFEPIKEEYDNWLKTSTPEGRATQEHRQAMGELQAAAQSGGLASADVAGREREVENIQRRLGVADDQRLRNFLTGSSREIVGSLANAAATAAEAPVLEESTRIAYDPLYSGLVGDDQERFRQEFQQETHEELKPLYDAADRLSDTAVRDIEQAKKGLGTLGQAGVDIGNTMLQMGFDAAVNVITNGGGLASMFLRVLGSAEQEARRNGETLERQLGYGVSKAGIEVLTEKLNGVAGKWAYGKGFVPEEFTEKLIEKLASSQTGKTALRLLIGGAEEVGEEALSDLLSPIAESMFRTDENGNPISLSEAYADEFTSEAMAEKARAYAIAFAVSLLGESGNVIGGKVNGALAESNQQQSAPAQFNAPEGTQELSGSEALARALGGQTEAQSEAQPVAPAEQEQAQNTIIDTSPINHSPEIQRSINEYVRSADGGLIQFLNKLRGLAKKTDSAWQNFSVAPVSNTEADAIYALTGIDTEGFQHNLNGENLLLHIVDEHGENGKTDHNMRHDEDIARMGYVLKNYDEIELAHDKNGNLDLDNRYRDRNNNKSPKIVYKKKLDGTYYVVEAVPDSSRKLLQIITAYIGPQIEIGVPEFDPGTPVESLRVSDAHTVAPAFTPEATRATPSLQGEAVAPTPDSSIPQNAPAVNTENAGTVRSQSEENTIQALDEQNNAPDEVRNPLYYNPVSEEESMSAARDYLENGYESDMPARISSKLTPEQATILTEAGVRLGGGYGKAMSDMQGSAVWTSVQQDMSTMIFDALAKDAAETGNWDAYEAWRIIDQEHGTEIARTLQARGKRTRGIATTLNETAEYIQSLNLSKEARDAVMNKVLPYAEKLEGISETDIDGLKQFITDIAKQRKTGTIIPGMLAKLMKNQDADFLSRLAKASVKSFAADHVPVDIGGKIKSYQTIAQLLKVTTAMRNLGGNETFGFMDALVGNTIGQAIDMAVKGKTGARSVAGDLRWLSSTQRKAMVDALEKSVLEIALDVDMGSVGTKYDPQRRAFSMSGNSAERFMSRLSQLLSYSLTSSDRFFRGGIEAGTVEGLNRLNAGNEAALAQSEDVAKALADYRLFQNDSKVAQGSKQVHDMLNNLLGVGGQTARDNPNIPKGQRRGGWGLGDLIMPYATVPANLAVKAFEYSPAGIVKGGVELAQVMKDAKNGKLDLKAQNKAVMDIARGTTGVPLAILFASLIKAGIVKRSDDDKDYDVTKARQTEGRRETQWNLDATLRWLSGGGRDWQEGDDLISLNWMEPINAFMDIGALFADVMDDGDADIADYAGKYVGGALQAFLEMPMVEGLQNAVQAVQRVDSDNWMEKAGKFAESTATSAVTGMMPGGISQLARALDPVTRDTSADTATQRIANAMMNAVPGLRKQLPEKLDSFAKPVKNENPLLNALNNLALPGVISEYAPDDVVQALDDVYAQTGKSNFYPDYKAPASFSYGKQDYALTTDEKRAWQESFGERYAELVRATIDSPQYDSMDAETKAKVFGEIRSAAAAEARGVVVTGRGDEFKSDYDSVLSLSDIPGYLSTKARFAEAAESRDYGEIDSILQAYGKLPEDVVEKLDKCTVTGNLDKLYEATQAGATTENWFKATDATKDLPIPDGKKEATDAQKWQAMAGVVSDKQADIILQGYMEEGTYERYMDARQEGVTAKQWTHAMAETSKLIPPDGQDEAPDWQKYEAMANAEPKAADAIFKGYLTENQYAQYTAARNAGVTPQQWAGANAGVAQVQPLQGEKGVKEWQQYEYIVQNYPKQAEALIPYFMNADGPRERFSTATEFGVKPELYVAYYKQDSITTGKDASGKSVTGLKKKRMEEWMVSQGYSKKQADYMYKLFAAQIKDLSGFNNNYKRG